MRIRIRLWLGACFLAFALALATPTTVLADAIPLVGTTDFMHARYYSPNLGRFVSVDPVGGTVGSSQSWNRYSYVLNSPLALVDPNGEETVSATTGFKIGLPTGLVKAAQWLDQKLDPRVITDDGVIYEGAVDPSVLGLEIGVQIGLAADSQAGFGVILQGTVSDIQGVGIAPAELSTQWVGTNLDSINDLEGVSTTAEVETPWWGGGAVFVDGERVGGMYSPQVHLGVGAGGGEQHTKVVNISELVDEMAAAIADYLFDRE